MMIYEFFRRVLRRFLFGASDCFHFSGAVSTLFLSRFERRGLSALCFWSTLSENLNLKAMNDCVYLAEHWDTCRAHRRWNFLGGRGNAKGWRKKWTFNFTADISIPSTEILSVSTVFQLQVTLRPKSEKKLIFRYKIIDAENGRKILGDSKWIKYNWK